MDANPYLEREGKQPAKEAGRRAAMGSGENCKRSVSLQAREALRAARKDYESCQQIKYQARAVNAGDVARVGCRLGGKGRGACITGWCMCNGTSRAKSGEERGRRVNG